jgi:hypothetical protein
MATSSVQAGSGSFAFHQADDVPIVPPRVLPVIDLPAPHHAATEPDLVVEHQKHMPDGQGAMVEEAATLPWVMGILATIVLIAGALVIGFTMSWTAALVGIVWLVMGYAVSWSVVWGAGLCRASDERIVEAKLDQGEMPPPAGRIG